MNEYTVNHLIEVLEASERPPRVILMRVMRDLDINDGFWDLYRAERWADMAAVVRERSGL